MIVFVGAVVIGATGAFFSDTETSTGNTFTAGAIDLKIDNESYYNGERNDGTTWLVPSDLDGQLFFDFRDLKPGDWGEDTISLHVNNNDAYACVDVRLDSDDDNGLTEPEQGDGDNTGGVGEGELADAVNFYWWADDGDNVFETGEQLLPAGPLGNLAVGQVATVALAQPGGGVLGTVLTGGQTYYIGKAWCFGNSDFEAYPEGDTGPDVRPVICDGSEEDNTTQTDGLTATISFMAVQSRNNGEFVCAPHLGDAPTQPEGTLETEESTSGEALAEFSTFDGVDGLLAHLKVAGTDGTPGDEARIVIQASDVSIATLNDLNTISWAAFGVTGYAPHVDVIVNPVGGEVALVFEYAKVDPALGCDDVGDYPTGNFNTFDDKGIVDSGAYAWLSSGPAGTCGSEPFDTNHNSLAEWKAGGPDGIDGDTPVLRLEIEVDNWIESSEAYINDVLVNGS